MAVDRAFAAFAENVRDYAIFLMDPSGTITFWGEGARRIKGWTRAEAEGAHLRLLYPPGGSEDGTAEAHLEWAAAHGEYTGEGQRIRSNGGSFWAAVAITALRDETGALLGFAKLSRDLTARRAEEALRLATAQSAHTARLAAQAASVAKNGFLATISHELRTPINAILGYTEMLEMEIDGPLTAGQRRHLTASRASGQQLLALVTNVLDFSDGEVAGRGAEARASVPIASVVADALARVAPAAASGLELVDAVRESAPGLTGWGDVTGVRQILGHLLDNAVKFSAPRDGHPGRITIRAGAVARRVFICVEDTGVGIPADRLSAVFEPFTQSNMQLTRTHGGLGLGLSISRQIARRMGGDVTVQSESGVGSAFFVWLPTAPVDLVPEADVSSGDTEPASTTAAPSNKATDAIRAVSDAVLGELERIMYAYVARLRTDPATPSAHAVDEAQIEDHIAAFLGNLASSLPSFVEALAASKTGPGESTKQATDTDSATSASEAERHDGVVIHRLVAERHGAQRARLGWSESEVRREFTILGEELTAAVARRVSRDGVSGASEATKQGVAGAMAVLTPFLEFAERASIASLRATVSATGQVDVAHISEDVVTLRQGGDTA